MALLPPDGQSLPEEAAQAEASPLEAPLPSLPGPKRRPSEPPPRPEGQLPPSSPEPRPPAGPSQSTGAPGTSSTASSEPTRPKPERKADPEEVKSALGEGVDIALELVCGGAGYLHQNVARGQELPGGAWRPTALERERIHAPAQRIIRRHTAEMGLVDADAIDAALVAAGLLRITTRSVLGPDKKRSEEAGNGES